MNTVTEVISYRNLYRQFEKPGTYDDAVKDFEKLLPRNVKELKLPGGVIIIIIIIIIIIMIMTLFKVEAQLD